MASEEETRPVVELYGKETNSKRDIAAAACRDSGLDLYLLAAQSLPSNPTELEAALRLWSREAALSSSALFIEYDEADTTDPVRTSLLEGIIAGCGGWYLSPAGIV